MEPKCIFWANGFQEKILLSKLLKHPNKPVSSDDEIILPFIIASYILIMGQKNVVYFKKNIIVNYKTAVQFNTFQPSN